MALIHILLTFSPFVFFSELLWTDAPFGLTLLGQYIIKNIIILGVLVVMLLNKKGKTISVSYLGNRLTLNQPFFEIPAL